MINSTLCDLLGIEYPVFQGGMAWISDGKLAAAVSNGGGLGIIGAGTAPGSYICEQIRIAASLTDKPFGVNIMLLSPFAAEAAQIAAEEKVAVVTTGAGSPAKYMALWKAAGIRVIPVIASAAMAKLVTRAGADAVIAEGCESGGHIGELTTFCLIPQVADAIEIPLIAAGGIADGRGMAAALLLGADAVQMGTAFICSRECTAHENYKNMILEAGDTATVVTGRGLGHPARSLKSRFIRRMIQMEKEQRSAEEMEQALLGSLRSAVIDGDPERGSFMAGQIAGLVREILPAAEIIKNVVSQAEELCGNLAGQLEGRGIILG
ncbi:MAG TPA: enoyl-[acyl-carrier-protein] reductase FabK [Clostridiales bacterium]|nr:enoyl-[acyl-carrier-protein] reductase FabK [Clostridiales bacterium]